jgi:hypothetical protein
VDAVVVTARGHGGITGRHGKTLELTAEVGITQRASCVVGVGADLPAGLRSLRGIVRLGFAAGGVEATVTGEVNPGYAAAGRLVVRRSDVLEPETFLVNASGAAGDLPRELLEVLADPGATVTVTATEVGEPDPVVVVLAAGARAPADVAELVAGADLVVDLTGAGAPAPSVALPARRVHAWPQRLAGVRTVVVLGDPVVLPLDPLPRRRVLAWPPAHPGRELLLAAGLPAEPVLLAGSRPQRAPWPVVVRTTGAGLDALRDRTLLVPDPAVGWGTGAVTVRPGEPLDPRGLRHRPAVVALPEGGTVLATDAATLARLLREGTVSGRTAAGVLTALGAPRKEAYRLATAPVDMAGGPPPPSR